MLKLISLVNMVVGAGGGHGGKEESVSDVVMHHLTDHVVEGNFIAKILEPVNTVLGGITFEVLGLKSNLAITKLGLMMWLAAVICIIIFIPVARKIKNAKYGSSSKWVNMWEVLVGFVHDEIVEPNFGHHYKKIAMPWFCTTFFFVLFCNLLGMIPYMSTATGNLAVTGALASTTLLGMIVIGTIKQGPQWIFTGIVPGGVPLPLFPLLWVIELMGLLIKPFALTVRLYANMTAGHIVIIIFIFLVMMFKSALVGIGSVAGALMINMLELLVAFIQAYIFTALSAMFIGASLHAH